MGADIQAFTHLSGQYVDENGNVLTVQDAFANVGSGQTEELVAAQIGSHIRIIAAVFMASDTATTVTFKSATTAISPDWPCGVNGGAAIPETRFRWGQTANNEALNVVAGTGSTVAVHIQYVLVPA